MSRINLLLELLITRDSTPISTVQQTSKAKEFSEICKQLILVEDEENIKRIQTKREDARNQFHSTHFVGNNRVYFYVHWDLLFSVIKPTARAHSRRRGTFTSRSRATQFISTRSRATQFITSRSGASQFTTTAAYGSAATKEPKASDSGWPLHSNTTIIRWEATDVRDSVVETLLSSANPIVDEICEQTLCLMLYLNEHHPRLLERVVQMCYTKNDLVGIRCFRAILMLFSQREFPCEYISLLCLCQSFASSIELASVRQTAFLHVQLLRHQFLNNTFSPTSLTPIKEISSNSANVQSEIMPKDGAADEAEKSAKDGANCQNSDKNVVTDTPIAAFTSKKEVLTALVQLFSSDQQKSLWEHEEVTQLCWKPDSVKKLECLVHLLVAYLHSSISDLQQPAFGGAFLPNGERTWSESNSVFASNSFSTYRSGRRQHLAQNMANASHPTNASQFQSPSILSGHSRSVSYTQQISTQKFISPPQKVAQKKSSDMRHSLLIGTELLSPTQSDARPLIRSQSATTLKLSEDNANVLLTEKESETISQLLFIGVSMMESNLDNEYFLGLSFVDKCKDGSALCVPLHCHFDYIGRNDSVLIEIRARLWNFTFSANYRAILTNKFYSS
uniref:Integrin alpha third immunoglobulin-like domain-containing protein n=1 Tax=Globodera rostochiensis TaxID=31243 RepID=A0A914HAU7_GLORO